MRLAFKLVGYDRVTERIVADYPIHSSKVKASMEIVGLDPNSSGPFVDYPLSAQQAARIAALINWKIIEHLDYFFETYADEEALA